MALNYGHLSTPTIDVINIVIVVVMKINVLFINIQTVWLPRYNKTWRETWRVSDPMVPVYFILTFIVFISVSRRGAKFDRNVLT